MKSLSNGYGTKTLKGNARWQAKELFQIPDGTPPEQFILKQSVAIPTHTIATDIWAFGMTIYVSARGCFIFAIVFGDGCNPPS